MTGCRWARKKDGWKDKCTDQLLDGWDGLSMDKIDRKDR